MKRNLILGNIILKSACLLIMLAVSAISFAANTIEIGFGSTEKESELSLSLGKSQIIQSATPLEQVVIGNPAIADIKLLNSRQVLILGITPGRTNLVFRDQQKNLVTVMDVVVGYDLNGIKRKIAELLPADGTIEVRGSNDSIILSGQVSSISVMDQALNVAKSYVPKENVVNLMEVAGGQQVMLEVHIAEVARNSLRQLGVTLNYTDTDGGLGAFVTGDAIPNFFGAFDVDSSWSSTTKSLSGRLEALEQQGLSKTLAEPNIVAMSGQEASFLAGGEFPIPVAQASTIGGNAGAVTIEYKEFGVGLKFIPTVLSDKKINIKLNTEVSAIDTSNTYSVYQGINIPTFLTRRAGTTIEMADGQGFVIAGLMQSDMNNAINKVPGLGSIPVLGALFRSTDYQRRETELVIVVTPRLVNPTNPAKLKLPTDNVIPATWLDQYLLGTLEHTRFLHSDKLIATEIGSTQMGLEGRYGHQLEEDKKEENKNEK